MIPPEIAIRSAAVQIEADLHEQGWDEPAALIQLDATELDPLGRALAVRVSELPFRGFVDGHPAIVLRGVADQFGEGHILAKLARRMADQAFCGLAFATEGWMRTAKDKDEALQMRGRRYADMPGSIEIRSVIVMDTAGRVTYCQRRRGKEPEVWTAGTDGDDFSGAGGRIPGALRDMVLAVALHMPPGTADVEALRGLKVEAERG